MIDEIIDLSHVTITESPYVAKLIQRDPTRPDHWLTRSMAELKFELSERGVQIERL